MRKMRKVILMGIILILSISLFAITMLVPTLVRAQAPACYNLTVIVPPLTILDDTDWFPEAPGQDVYCKITIEKTFVWKTGYTAGINKWQTTLQYEPAFLGIPATYDSKIGCYYNVTVELWDDDFMGSGEPDDLLAKGSARLVANPRLNPQKIDLAGTTYCTGGTAKVWITHVAKWDVKVVVPPLTILDDTDWFPEAPGQDVYCKITIGGIVWQGDQTIGENVWETGYTAGINKWQTTPEYEHTFLAIPATPCGDGYRQYCYPVTVELWDDDWPKGTANDELLASGSASLAANPELNPQPLNMKGTDYCTGGTAKVWITGPGWYTLTITTTPGGTTNPAPGTYTYLEGGGASVTAIPNTGYYLDHWELDENNVGATNPISVTMNQDHYLHAVFLPARVYAGGTNPGVVYYYDGGTSWKKMSPSLGWSVTSIVYFEGTLFASAITDNTISESSGLVYRYDAAKKTWNLTGTLSNQVTFLIVYKDELYAGTATPARLYKYNTYKSITTYDVTVVVPPLTIKATSDFFPETDGPDVYCKIKLAESDPWESAITYDIPVRGMTPRYEHTFRNAPATGHGFTVTVELWDDDWPKGTANDELLASGKASVVADPQLNPQTFNIEGTEYCTGGLVNVSTTLVASWEMVLEYPAWYGFRSAYWWGDWLWLGEWNYDRFARWNTITFDEFQPSEIGSCVYTFETYGAYLYAGAWVGRIFRLTYEPPTATEIWGPEPYNRYAWTLKAFKGYLYIGFDSAGTGVAPLYRYDGASLSRVWSYSTTTTNPNEGIISLASDRTYLYVGVGGEAVGYPGDMSGNGTGKVYRTLDGTSFELVSGALGTGVQTLYIGPKFYDVTIKAYCNIESRYVSVSITMDGSPGFSTPHTFAGLTGSHTFTVPSTDASGHPFEKWNTGDTSTTMVVTDGGTYTAYWYTGYYGGVPEFPLGSAIYLAAIPLLFYLWWRGKQRTLQ